MSLRNLFILLSIISFFCLITKTYAQGAKLIDTFQSADWTAHIYENDGKRICLRHRSQNRHCLLTSDAAKLSFTSRLGQLIKFAMKSVLKLAIHLRPEVKPLLKLAIRSLNYLSRTIKLLSQTPKKKTNL